MVIRDLAQFKSFNRKSLEQANELMATSTILSCIDSRTSDRINFDQGLGDSFLV
jgi:carbonic anhydrase